MIRAAAVDAGAGAAARFAEIDWEQQRLVLGAYALDSAVNVADGAASAAEDAARLGNRAQTLYSPFGMRLRNVEQLLLLVGLATLAASRSDGIALTSSGESVDGGCCGITVDWVATGRLRVYSNSVTTGANTTMTETEDNDGADDALHPYSRATWLN